MQNSKSVGDATEVAVLHELVSHGYQVSIPFGDNAKYDLLVDDGSTVHRVQCKTAWTAKSGAIRFNTHSQTTKDGEYHETTYHGEIDAFAVKHPEFEDMYWIPVEEATNQKMDLRFEAEIDHPSINWASEFEFAGRVS